MEVMGMERQNVCMGSDVNATRVGTVIVPATQQWAQLVWAWNTFAKWIEPVYYLCLKKKYMAVSHT